MPKFTKKPVTVEAVKYEPGEKIEDGFEQWDANDAISRHGGTMSEKDKARYWFRSSTGLCFAPYIDTLEGRHYISPGDWVITGIKGERYPCKPDIFAATYDPADAEALAMMEGE